MKKEVAILTLTLATFWGCQKENNTTPIINNSGIKDTIIIDRSNIPQIPDTNLPIPIISYKKLIWVDPTIYESKLTWSSTKNLNSSSSFNNGKENSKKLLEQNIPPALLCENSTAYGFNDWYLPSYAELTSILNNHEIFFDSLKEATFISSTFNHYQKDQTYILYFKGYLVNLNESAALNSQVLIGYNIQPGYIHEYSYSDRIINCFCVRKD